MVMYIFLVLSCVCFVICLLCLYIWLVCIQGLIMTPPFGRSVLQVLVVRVDIGVETYEAMTPQGGRSVVQVLVVRVDIGLVIYEAMTPQGKMSRPGLQSGYISCDLSFYVSLVKEVDRPCLPTCFLIVRVKTDVLKPAE